VIRCILFDLDGTLIDSYDAIAESLNIARKAFSLPPYPREEVVRRVGHGLEDLMEQALGAENVVEGVRLFREHYQKVSLPMTQLLPGVESTARKLRERGYALAIITNKPAYFSRKILENLGVEDLFPVIYGPELAPAKPNPEMVFRSLKDCHCSKAEAIIVGDMTVDRDTARNAGLPFYAIPTGSESRETLLASGPDQMLEHFEDLLDLLPPLAGKSPDPHSTG